MKGLFDVESAKSGPSMPENLSVDLSAPGVATALAARIKSDIDAYCVKAYNDGYRSHLGASLIGRECSRELWYSFRWVGAAPIDGRVYRLFNRGHREEARFIEWLRGIGFEVVEGETNEAGEFKQLRVSGVAAHFGGSLDGRLAAPAHYKLSDPILLGEFKTSGTGRKFSELLKSGVAIAKPEHFAQMSVYGFKRQIKYALYLCINKNDDDLHVEIVRLDWGLAEMLEKKAGDIITSTVPPNRISQQSTYFKCTLCDFKRICWEGYPLDKNCRSCRNSVPTENAQWHCGLYQAVIPKDYIAKGCDNWQPIA